MRLVIWLYMFRYILLILILIIFLGHLQITGAVESVRHNFIDYCKANISMNNSSKNCDQKESRFRRIKEWEKYIHNKSNKIFSLHISNSVDTKSWKYYKKTFISNDGRVMDPLRASVTTSEGQAYAMQRALIMRDKATFDKVYNWSIYNLQHKDDKLFGWLWGQKNPEQQNKIEYGIIDSNSASDGDIEIAICLIFASKVWNQNDYIENALEILKDIWNKETVEINGERVLASGINQAKLENIEINPSYFMLNSFRVFAEIDKEHDWQKLVDSSYRLTNYCIDNIKSGLPPDIFYINRNTGAITFDQDKSDFYYDAVRVFYRFYIDYIINKDSRAEKLLSMSRIFINRWKCEKKFYTNYKQNGELKNYDEPIGSIAVLLPVIKMYDSEVTEDVYKNRIKAKYNKKGYWGNPVDYYAQNLVWFGNWLYQNEENIQAFQY